MYISDNSWQFPIINLNRSPIQIPNLKHFFIQYDLFLNSLFGYDCQGQYYKVCQRSRKFYVQ